MPPQPTQHNEAVGVKHSFFLYVCEGGISDKEIGKKKNHFRVGDHD